MSTDTPANRQLDRQVYCRGRGLLSQFELGNAIKRQITENDLGERLQDLNQSAGFSARAYSDNLIHGRAGGAANDLPLPRHVFSVDNHTAEDAESVAALLLASSWSTLMIGNIFERISMPLVEDNDARHCTPITSGSI